MGTLERLTVVVCGGQTAYLSASADVGSQLLGKDSYIPGMVIDTFNPSTRDGEEGIGMAISEFELTWATQ